MKVPNFSLETVFTFLEYIYAGLKWNDQVKHRPYMKDFDMGKITPELMKMCHTYQVDGLFQECSYQLSLKVSDNNVVSLWIDAEKCEAKLLKDRAMLHIKRKKKDIANLMKSLVDFMANLKMHAAMVLYYESYIILSAIISAYIEHNKYHQLPWPILQSFSRDLFRALDIILALSDNNK